MKAVFLTAGAAGMFCGSCMHDNALAKAVRAGGVDCLLQPVYTPIRTDEDNIAAEDVFFGGIHIYLLQRLPWLRFLPAPLRRVLDWPPLIRFATRRAGSTDPAHLGSLAISMLEGSHGPQREEVERLVRWLAEEVKPDAVILSNLLIGGALPEIRKRLPNTKLIVLLQGDDIFLDHLPADARAEAIRLCSQLAQSVDHFILNSRFYAAKMGSLLNLPSDKIVLAPLSIDTAAYRSPHQRTDQISESSASLGQLTKSENEFRVGYLARIAPEKGLHRLVDAFVQVAQNPGNQQITLHVAGWLGEHNRPYFDSLRFRIDSAGLSSRFVYHGSPNLEQKVAFLRTLDTLSVPTEYEDPKGLFVLEALAAGVPVVQPDHGAFGELIQATGGGLLVAPDSQLELSRAIEQLHRDPQLRARLAQNGEAALAQRHTIQHAAAQLTALFS